MVQPTTAIPTDGVQFGPTFSIYVRFRKKRLRLHRNLPSLDAAVRIAQDLCRLRFHDPKGILVENDETKRACPWLMESDAAPVDAAPAAPVEVVPARVAVAPPRAPEPMALFRERTERLSGIVAAARERLEREAVRREARLQQLQLRLPAERFQDLEQRWQSVVGASTALLASLDRTVAIFGGPRAA